MSDDLDRRILRWEECPGGHWQEEARVLLCDLITRDRKRGEEIERLREALADADRPACVCETCREHRADPEQSPAGEKD